MKERPILFSGPMVRAILEGRKTQTRRVLKHDPSDDWKPAYYCDINGYDEDGELSPDVVIGWGAVNQDGDEGYVCPYGKPGNRLWVRENFSGPYGCRNLKPKDWPDNAPIWHWADGNPVKGDWTKPKPSIHMPRWASRITLEITGIRVERLQDISEADAKAEGCAPAWLDADDHETIHADQRPTYRRGFSRLWCGINGPESWDANPWVWVIEFQRVRP